MMDCLTSQSQIPYPIGRTAKYQLRYQPSGASANNSEHDVLLGSTSRRKERPAQETGALSQLALLFKHLLANGK